jgi:hypothetical protein
VGLKSLKSLNLTNVYPNNKNKNNNKKKKNNKVKSKPLELRSRVKSAQKVESYTWRRIIPAPRRPDLIPLGNGHFINLL